MQQALMTSLSPKPGERIVVAMSGGVDSSAAALMLAEAGYEVIGISMQVWDYRRNGGSASRATCCAPTDFDDAREVAEAADFPYYVYDFESSFSKSVIAPFVDSYLRGYTPNPCLDCNRKVKFRELRRRAEMLGADVVATGHFAQIREKDDGRLGLYTSVDGDKDQTYFLYAMTQEDLRRTVFPVGGMTKPKVREYLASRGMHVAKKAESQDICFVGSTVSEFIEKYAGKQEAGEIKNVKGEVLGRHYGVHRYTVGQRKGLGVSHKNPLYVLNIDSDARQVTVGSKDELERESFLVRDVHWISGVQPAQAVYANVKLRYRHPGVRCRIEMLKGKSGVAKLTFTDQWTAISPGQAAVFYRDQEESDGSVEVLGGGILSKDCDGG